MSTSDDRPNLEEATVEEMRQDVRDLLDSGEVLLSGPSSVQMVVRVEDAATPVEAVERVIQRIAHIGFDSFTFAITDKLTGDDYFVQGGKLVSLDAVRKTIEQADEQA